MPDKTKKTYVLNEAGEWQEGGVEMDYSKLTNAPITLANLADKNFIPEVNTYYEHLGETTEDFVKGIIYLYNGAEYKAIDGSGSGAGVQPDYDQNDPTQPDYIKNRPFYTKSESEVQKTLVFKGEINGFTGELPSLFEVGDLVSLKEDSIGLNVTDNAKSYTMSDGTIIYIGNLSIIFAALGIDGAVDTKEDYCLMCMSIDSNNYLWYANKNHNPPSTIEVYKGADPTVRIPEKYMPLEIAKKSYVDNAISSAITKTLNTEV